MLGWEQTQHTFYYFARVCFALQLLYVWYFGHKRFRASIRRLDDYFTDDRTAALHRLTVLLWLFGVTSIAAAIWNFIGREAFYQKAWLAVPSILMTVLIYVLGYVAFSIQNPVQGIAEESDFNGENKEELLSGDLKTTTVTNINVSD